MMLGNPALINLPRRHNRHRLRGIVLALRLRQGRSPRRVRRIARTTFFALGHGAFYKVMVCLCGGFYFEVQHVTLQMSGWGLGTGGISVQLTDEWIFTLSLILWSTWIGDGEV